MPLISLLAFFIKGITGMGTSIVIVSLSSIVIGSKAAVVLAALINIVGGLVMARVGSVHISRRYWWPIGGAMIGGSVIGAFVLKYIPHRNFDVILGIAVFLAGIWFLLNGRITKYSDPYKSAPDAPSSADVGVGLLAGVLGGFVGVNSPPLLLHFGRYLRKDYLRRFLILIYIPAAFAQTATFVSVGLVSKEILLYAVLMIPTLFMGVYAGNLVFANISEKWFRRITGALIILISLKLIF